MSTQVQFRRGTTAENDAFTGALAEVTVDTTNNTLRVHNGSTAGGEATVGVSATQTVSNKTFTNCILVTPDLGAASANTMSLIGPAPTGGAVLTVSGNIQTDTANNTANIGNATNYFNTVHAQATAAQYADVAELYTADAPYGPGTVLIFGGDQEVTAHTQSHSTAVAGVVSENPSHLMNAGLKATHVVAVALLGRVPCQVRGEIHKGDLLVASDQAGVAERLNLSQYQPGCVIGKSLENYHSDQVGRIEIAVGVK